MSENDQFTISVHGNSNNSKLVLSSSNGSISKNNSSDLSLNVLIENLNTLLTNFNSLTNIVSNLATNNNLDETKNLCKLINNYNTNSMKELKAIYLTNLAGIPMEREPGMGFFSKNMFWSQVYNSMKIAANNFNIDLKIRGPGEDITNDKDMIQQGIQWGLFGRADLTENILDNLLDMTNNEEQLPDILIYSNFNNDISLGKIKQLSDYGVDVYSINTNIDDITTMGASYYIGADDSQSSVLLSNYLKNTFEIGTVIIMNAANPSNPQSPPSWLIRENGIRSIFTDISVVNVSFDSSQNVVNQNFENIIPFLTGNTMAIFVGDDAELTTTATLYSSHINYWSQFDVPQISKVNDLSNCIFAGCIPQNQHLQGFLPLMIGRSKYDEYYKDPSNANLINLKLPPGFPVLPEELNFIDKLPNGNIVNTAGSIITSLDVPYITRSSSLYV